MSKFKSDTSIKCGNIQWFSSNTGLLATKWKDKQCVHMLSNFYQPEDVRKVERKEKGGRIS